MSAYSQPTQPCPYCGTEMECDWVDVGVGCTQCGPYICDRCGASEIGPHDDPSLATSEEQKAGYYRNKHSPYANQIAGCAVDHRAAEVLYKMGLLDPKPCDVESSSDRNRASAEQREESPDRPRHDQAPDAGTSAQQGLRGEESEAEG